MPIPRIEIARALPASPSVLHCIAELHFAQQSVYGGSGDLRQAREHAQREFKRYYDPIVYAKDRLPALEAYTPS